MSKNRITAAIAVAAVLAVGGTSTLAAAQAASGGPGNDNNDGQVIHLTERDTHTQFTGTFLSNPQAGDQVILSNDLLGTDGAKVGHGGVVCEVVSPAPAPHVAPDELCQSSYVFADGQIELGGLVNTSAVPTHSPFTIGVTGGTGRYAQAHGELTVVPKSQGVNELTIDLS